MTNNVIGYAVYRNSLVYVFIHKGVKRAGVFRSFESHINELSDPLYIDEFTYGKFRKATRADFDYYRVSLTEHMLLEIN